MSAPEAVQHHQQPSAAVVSHLRHRLFGLLLDVLHVLDLAGANMRVRALSPARMVSAADPEMDRAATVTIFNDPCVVAPAPSSIHQ